MDFTLRELECFVAVAEELSFTRAARRLRLAQPPLSRHIRVLEEKIGSALFERLPRGARLTPAGRCFHEETRGVLPQLTRAAESARRAALGEELRLRLGFVSAVAGPEWMDVLRDFRASHPAVQLLLHDLPPAEQLARVAQGKLDAGFVGLPPRERPPGVRFANWRQEPLRVFVPAGHRLAARASVRFADLREEQFITVSREAAPAFAMLFHEQCRKAGFKPRVVLDAPRAQAVAVMVAAGSGIAVLPASLAKFLGDAAVGLEIKGVPRITHVVAFPVKPAPGPLRELLALVTK